MIKNNIDKEKLKKELIHIEKTYVKKYFANFLENETKQNPCNIKNRKDFLKRLFIVSIYKLVGGRAKIEYAEKGYDSFSKFVDSLNNKNISDYYYFSRKLESYTHKMHKSFYSKFNEGNIKDIINLTAFKGMGQKTASLFLRFLCCYTNFFNRNKPQDLLVPLDRVNWRFCFKEKKTFNKKDFESFQDFALSIMKNPKDRIYFDNIWFIGHFWHDRRKTNSCQISRVTKAIEGDCLKGIKLPLICPLYNFCSKKDNLFKGEKLK
jgi:hypothetical protein